MFVTITRDGDISAAVCAANVLAAGHSELQGDGIDTSLVLRAADHPSPFTYIIVDREGALLVWYMSTLHITACGVCRTGDLWL
jgi:hypothetical protein